MPASADTPRIFSISLLVTGCRYATTAKVSMADWLNFTGGGSWRKILSQRPKRGCVINR